MTRKLLIGAVALFVLLAMGTLWLYAKPATPTSQGPFDATSPTSSMHNVPAIPATTDTPRPQPVLMAFATSTPTIGTPTAIPNTITVNTSTQVTVTVQITDPTLIPGSVNLLNIGAPGSQPTILGVMHDDGLNGDAIAGDQIYTVQTVLTSTTVGQIQLEVSAAFRGQLRRYMSGIAVVNVWALYTDPNTGISLALPTFGSSETLSSSPEMSGVPATVQLLVVDPTNNSNVITLFTLALNNNPQHLSLEAWFEQNVDYNNLLLNAGDVQTQVLPSGVTLLTVQGPFPQQYLNYVGGPLPELYAMTADGSHIVTVGIPEDPSLADLNLSPSSLRTFLPNILSTLAFQ